MTGSTAAESHTPPDEATCPERWAPLGTAHACSWISHEGDVHRCVCGDVWNAGKVGCRAVPAASMTGEGLRELLTERLNTTLVTPEGGIEQSDCKFDRHDRHNFLHNCAACQGNVPAIVTALLAVVSPVLERQQAEIERLADFGVQSRERHQAEIERLRDVNRILAGERDTWKTRTETARAERDALRETLAETDLGAQVLAQWEAIAAADADRDRLEAQVAALQRELATVKAENEYRLRRDECLKAELAEARAKVAELEAELTNHRANEYHDAMATAGAYDGEDPY